MYLSQLKEKICDFEFVRQLLIDTIRRGPVPGHVAFILDGNRRLAKARDISISEGHSLGARSLKRVRDFCYDSGITVVTVYTFSLDNFKRPKKQVDEIMRLLKENVMKLYESDQQAGREIRFHVCGRPEKLEEDSRETLTKAASTTRDGQGGTFNVCIAYTSTDEIARAVQKTVEERYQKTQADSESCSKSGKISAQDVMDNMDVVNDPPLDLLVRTSGVCRLSNFLLWQCNQDTEIQVLDLLWPEFTLWDLCLVILQWQRKNNGHAVNQRDTMGDISEAKGWRYVPAVRLHTLSFTFFLLLCSVLWLCNP